MIIDNLKEFIAKFADTQQKNNDCKEEDFGPEEKLGGDSVCKEKIEGGDIIDVQKEPFEEPLGGIQDPDDVWRNLNPEDVIDEPTLCMYGPAPGYDDKDLVTCVHDEDDIIEKKDAQR